MDDDFRARIIGRERYLGNVRAGKDFRFACPFCGMPVKLWLCNSPPDTGLKHFVVAVCDEDNVAFMHDEWWYYKELEIDAICW